VQAAREAIAPVAVRTPTIACAELAEPAGGAVVLKAESLQATGSFKLRGALAKVAALGERASGGLVAASAGNHAARGRAGGATAGVGCEVFMPRDAAVSKVAAVERLGARVRLVGSSVEEALELAAADAAETGAALIHPFERSRRDRRPGAPSGSSCSRTSPTSRASSCPSAGAGWQAASGSRCAAPGRTSSSSASRRARAHRFVAARRRRH